MNKQPSQIREVDQPNEPRSQSRPYTPGFAGEAAQDTEFDLATMNEREEQGVRQVQSWAPQLLTYVWEHYEYYPDTNLVERNRAFLQMIAKRIIESRKFYEQARKAGFTGPEVNYEQIFRQALSDELLDRFPPPSRVFEGTHILLKEFGTILAQAKAEAGY